jgi:hypothetical protein
VGADPYLDHPLWNDNAALAAGKGLLILMGMEQEPGERAVGIGFEHDPIGGDDIPAIGIVFPAGVWVFYGYMKGPGATLS